MAAVVTRLEESEAERDRLQARVEAAATLEARLMTRVQEQAAEHEAGLVEQAEAHRATLAEQAAACMLALREKEEAHEALQERAAELEEQAAELRAQAESHVPLLCAVAPRRSQIVTIAHVSRYPRCASWRPSSTLQRTRRARLLPRRLPRPSYSPRSARRARSRPSPSAGRRCGAALSCDNSRAPRSWLSRQHGDNGLRPLAAYSATEWSKRPRLVPCCRHFPHGATERRQAERRQGMGVHRHPVASISLPSISLLEAEHE